MKTSTPTKTGRNVMTKLYAFGALVSTLMGSSLNAVAAPPPTQRPVVQKAVAAAPVTPAPTPVPDATAAPFVEIEGTPDRIEQVARRLARTPADYRLESYPRLYADWCAARGLTPGDMTFR